MNNSIPSYAEAKTPNIRFTKIHKPRWPSFLVLDWLGKMLMAETLKNLKEIVLYNRENVGKTVIQGQYSQIPVL